MRPREGRSLVRSDTVPRFLRSPPRPWRLCQLGAARLEFPTRQRKGVDPPALQLTAAGLRPSEHIDLTCSFPALCLCLHGFPAQGNHSPGCSKPTCHPSRSTSSTESPAWTPSSLAAQNIPPAMIYRRSHHDSTRWPFWLFCPQGLRFLFPLGTCPPTLSPESTLTSPVSLCGLTLLLNPTKSHLPSCLLDFLSIDSSGPQVQKGLITFSPKPLIPDNARIFPSLQARNLGISRDPLPAPQPSQASLILPRDICHTTASLQAQCSVLGSGPIPAQGI